MIDFKYPGLFTFLVVLFPVPAFFFIRYVMFIFWAVTKNEPYWSGYTYQAFYLLTTLWVFALPVFVVSRFSYWLIIRQEALAPWWDTGLGILAIPLLLFVGYMYLLALGLSMAAPNL